MGLFSKKSPVAKLEKAYRKKLSDAHSISHTNRKEGDRLLAEAEEIAKKIEALSA